VVLRIGTLDEQRVAQGLEVRMFVAVLRLAVVEEGSVAMVVIRNTTRMHELRLEFTKRNR